MNKYQKANIEEELQRMWRKVDAYRLKCDVATSSGEYEKAGHYDEVAKRTIAKIDGVRIALSALGYMVIWKDEKQTIVPLA